MDERNRPGSIVPVWFLSVISAARPARCAFSVSHHRTGIIVLLKTSARHAAASHKHMKA